MYFLVMAMLSDPARTVSLETVKARNISILISVDEGIKTPSGATSDNAARLFKYLEEETHVHFQLTSLPWKRALISARNGEGFLYGASKNPERAGYLKFSEPIYSDSVWLVKRCDNSLKFEHLYDLKDKSIGVIRGASYGEEFDRAANVIFKAELDANDNQARFAKLLKKRTDAMVIYSQVQKASLLENALQERFGFIAAAELGTMKTHPYCVLPRPVSTQTIHFAVAPGHDEAYLERLNAALVKARESGKLMRIFSGLLPKE